MSNTSLPTQTNPEEVLLQVRQAARRLRIHENTLRRWAETGFVNAVRLPSGVRRFREEDIERLHSEIYGARSRSRDKIVADAASDARENKAATV